MPIEGTISTGTNFWLNFGAEQVYNSLQAGRDAADRLQRSIVWVFGIYSSIGIASAVFSKPQDWCVWALALFGTAFLFLVLGYWQATVASFASVENFYSNAEASVKEALTKAITRYKCRFNISITLTSIGTALYAVALLLQFSSPAVKALSPPAKAVDNATLAVKGHLLKAADSTYAFQIQTRKNSWNEVILIRDTHAKEKTVSDTLPIHMKDASRSLWLFVDSSGRIDFSISRVPSKDCHLQVNRSDADNTGNLVTRLSLRYRID